MDDLVIYTAQFKMLLRDQFPTLSGFQTNVLFQVEGLNQWTQMYVINYIFMAAVTCAISIGIQIHYTNNYNSLNWWCVFLHYS